MDSERPDNAWSELELAELDAGWDALERTPALAERATHVRLVTANESKARPKPSERKVQRGVVAGLVLLVAGGLGWSTMQRVRAPRAVDVSVRASVGDVPSAASASAAAASASAAALSAARAAPNGVASREDDTTNTLRVLVEIEPAGAQVYSRGERIGSDLVNIELLDGAFEELSIQHEGYVTRTLVVDGSRDFVRVELVPAPRAKRSRRPIRAHTGAPRAEAPAESSEAQLAYP